MSGGTRSLLDFDLWELENGLQVGVTSGATQPYLYKQWVVRDVADACDVFEKIVAELRQSEVTGKLFDHRIEAKT